MSRWRHFFIRYWSYFVSYKWYLQQNGNIKIIPNGLILLHGYWQLFSKFSIVKLQLKSKKDIKWIESTYWIICRLSCYFNHDIIFKYIHWKIDLYKKDIICSKTVPYKIEMFLKINVVLPRIHHKQLSQVKVRWKLSNLEDVDKQSSIYRVPLLMLK
jgi:hypothetical protein